MICALASLNLRERLWSQVSGLCDILLATSSSSGASTLEMARMAMCSLIKSNETSMVFNFFCILFLSIQEEIFPIFYF